ncbi:MAG: hypothetical protein U1F52_21375 [Burkholderiales bacterium]
MNRIHPLWRGAAAAVLALACAAQAHDLTVQECHEGSDFIRNAALSREAGIARAEFIDRMRSDIDLIQSYPPELRWFVQDDDDEQLLLGAAQKVFDTPDAPERHRAEFLASCFAAIERWARH